MCWQKFPHNFRMIPGAEKKNVYTDSSWIEKSDIMEYPGLFFFHLIFVLL